MAFFLFTDVVNSAAYRDWKGPMPPGSGPEDTPFTAMILRFYREMRQALEGEWEETCKAEGVADAPGAGVVKSMGDAMLFRIDPRTPAQLAAACVASANALGRFNQGEAKAGTWLRVLGMAWIAMTPSPNRSIPTSLVTGHPATGEFADDCIGPAMELGFRIMGSAKPGRMAITPDLAWMLLNDGQCRKSIDSAAIRFDRAEPRPLKSMFVGMDVPDIGVITDREVSRADREESSADLAAIYGELTDFMTKATETTWLTRPCIS
jgi:class 3 adenylate cyclase